MKEELIAQIIDLEWPMFASVENQGGKASCQSRPQTFEVMRSSQFLSWSEPVLASYLQDLKNAVKEKRNLCSEKYAFMMEVTAPSEYGKIQGFLPAISEKTLQKIKEIVTINISWEEEVDRNYPAIRSNGRPLRKSEDSQFGVSVETYLSCELKTYSDHTIDLLYAYTLECREKGINLPEQILANTMKAYGFETLAEAEEELK